MCVRSMITFNLINSVKKLFDISRAHKTYVFIASNINTPESSSVVYKHTEKNSLYCKKTTYPSTIYMGKSLKAMLR